MDKCKFGEGGGKCDFCNPDGDTTTTTKDSIAVPEGKEEQFYITKGKYLGKEIKLPTSSLNKMDISVPMPQFTLPGTKKLPKVPEKPTVKEPEDGGILDLPSPEDWVKKYFPKGSKVLGPVRGLKAFQSQVFRYTKGTEDNISPARKGKGWGWCWACAPVRLSHVLPSRQRCPCGCLWSTHYGHICSKCDTQCYPILTLTGYWVSLSDNVLFSTEEGCTCGYCTYRDQRRGLGQTRPRAMNYPRPTAKPTSGASSNLEAKDYGLDPKLILVEAAANFYLLVEMGAMEPLTGELDEKFRAITARLADQLCLYLELACLGEFRYTREYLNADSILTGANTWFPDNPYVCLNEKEIKKQKRQRLATKALMRDLRDAVSVIVGGRSSRDDERMAAWSVWKPLHKKYGDRIYSLMIYGFRELTWGRGSKEEGNVSMGGPKWAVCVEAVQAYRKGMPSVVFVDQALSLKHNGNIAFNKFFDVLGLDWVINWAFKGDTKEIQHYATDDIRKAWQVWRMAAAIDEERRRRDEQKQKKQEQAKEQSD